MNFDFTFNSFFRKILGFTKNNFFFNLIGIIINSYNNFFKKKYNPVNNNNVNNNNDNNLISIFKEIFPIKNFKHNLLIEYIDFKLSKPHNDYLYCIKNGLSYFSNLKAKFCISSLKKGGKFLKKFLKCQYIDIASIPLMTESGSFIINGVEKVVVSKFTRAPGIYFLNSFKNKKKIFLIKIIPDKGLNFIFFINDFNLLFLKVLNYEISLIHLLRYMGLSNKNIIDNFYNYQQIYFFNDTFNLKFIYKYFLNIIIPYDIIDNNNNILVNKNVLINKDILNKIKDSNIDFIKISEDYLIGKFIANDIIIDNLPIAVIGDILDNSLIVKIKSFKVKNISIICFSTSPHSSVILSINNSINNTLKIKNIVEKFISKIGFNFIKKRFFNSDIFFRNKITFDISCIRKKINYKLNKTGFSGPNYFNSDDIYKIIKNLILFKDGLYPPDDMNSLNSISLNLSGDILYEIFRKILLNLKKFFCRRIYKKKNINLLPEDFLKFNTLDIEIKKFFNISRYSQFLDQTNILSELSHKRRVSFLGMPGVSSKHSSFDVRDLNFSYYSKLCPVETPEGINIGLINSLSLLTLVNRDRELISPYYKVIKNKILNRRIYYLSSLQESNLIFCDSSKKVYPNNFIKNSLINARCNDHLIITKSNLVNYIDILSSQILSVCASLIPFIEYNDSNRALMASNMLKQALPCLFPQRPIIGTGLEYLIGTNSVDIIKSKDFSIVKYVDSSTIILEKMYKKKSHFFFDYDIYNLEKNRSSNQNTLISQRFILNLNDNVRCGQILNDNSCTDKGELSLGQNMIVAFMSWGGYNFEDSIIVSEKVVSDERYTSIEAFTIDISFYSDDIFCDILSRDINIDNIKKNKLDEFGIIKVGSMVSSGDLLVGKKTNFLKKKFDIISNEKKLINIILKNEFSEYVESKDSSFFLPNNFNLSLVNNVEVFFSKNFPLTDIDKSILELQSNKFLKNKKKIFNFFLNNIKGMIKGFLFNKEIFDDNERIIICDYKILNKINIKKMLNIKLKDNKINIFYKKFSLKFKKYIKIYNFMCKNINEKFIKVLPININKIVKLYFLRKKKLQIGDKMSGRHGNKGVISKIIPVHEMPYMSNGTPIDIILNPLGVPSRMNVGQLLEVHLGFISFLISLKIKKLLFFKKYKSLKIFIYNIYNILNDKISLNIKKCSKEYLISVSKYLINGFYFGISAFNNFKEENINKLFNFIISKFKDIEFSDVNKQIYLYDGKTGKKFDNPITVGLMYILKLNHLSEDKIHSRSVGPYSLVTQQPLKGKSNMGGQRVGEMEVWALEAYGASHTLKDMLTIKSDDMKGRVEAYKNIISGSLKFKYNIPESFNVMMSNINALGIYSRFIE
ncbi:DNA-directed RNA polymerase beta subunit [Candidatus Nasuia deltocephalinicola]|nr:DNA-directed RNA polymerase beta subunit [Candidatus Nasuia deltocephalinicola]